MLLGCVGTGQYLLKNTLSKAGREAGERGGTNPQIYILKTRNIHMCYEIHISINIHMHVYTMEKVFFSTIYAFMYINILTLFVLYSRRHT